MINAALLPSRVMLDTNVLSFIHDPPTGRVEEAPSKELWDALVAHKRDILLAAPTLAEYVRRGIKVPQVRGVEVISFDSRAAMALGTGLPMTVLKQVQNQGGVPMTHLKFDALILACAVRGRADVLVTYDSDMAKLQAGAVGADFGRLRIVTPAFFQMVAPPPAPPAATPAAPKPPNVPVADW